LLTGLRVFSHNSFTELLQKVREKQPIGEYEIDGVDNHFVYSQDGQTKKHRTKGAPQTPHGVSASSWCSFYKCW
jgi:hypothetical protein